MNLDEGSRIGHIVFISNNCAGQNKNRTMIRFCNWLKEVCYATNVTFIFLIKGHTKNLCD